MRCTIVLPALAVLAPVAAGDLDDLDWLPGCWLKSSRWMAAGNAVSTR